MNNDGNHARFNQLQLEIVVTLITYNSNVLRLYPITILPVQVSKL